MRTSKDVGFAHCRLLCLPMLRICSNPQKIRRYHVGLGDLPGLELLVDGLHVPRGYVECSCLLRDATEDIC